MTRILHTIYTWLKTPPRRGAPYPLCEDEWEEVLQGMKKADEAHAK